MEGIEKASIAPRCSPQPALGGSIGEVEVQPGKGPVRRFLPGEPSARLDGVHGLTRGTGMEQEAGNQAGTVGAIGGVGGAYGRRRAELRSREPAFS